MFRLCLDYVEDICHEIIMRLCHEIIHLCSIEKPFSIENNLNILIISYFMYISIFWRWVIGIVLFIFIAAGFRVVRQTERAVKERLGRYVKYCNPGFQWIIPFVDHLYKVNVTEQMVDAEPQEIITNDNLNARVDAQVYFRVKSDEHNVKASQYEVDDYERQIVNLARTTLRNIIGTMTLKSANSERDTINAELMKTLKKETQNWGIEVVRTELKEIDPPKDVQDTMNKVVKAENEKIAASDFATARETEADGIRRAKIKEAEGLKQAKILEAQGQAESIKLVNESANKYFVGNAQLLKKLETTENALRSNSKIVISSDSELINVIGDLSGASSSNSSTVLPIVKSVKTEKKL